MASIRKQLRDAIRHINKWATTIGLPFSWQVDVHWYPEGGYDLRRVFGDSAAAVLSRMDRILQGIPDSDRVSTGEVICDVRLPDTKDGLRSCIEIRWMSMALRPDSLLKGRAWWLVVENVGTIDRLNKLVADPSELDEDIQRVALEVKGGKE